jgi:hypothetical protein
MTETPFVTYREFDDSIFEKINIDSQLFIIIRNNLYVKKRIDDIKIGQVVKISTTLIFEYDIKIDEIGSQLGHIYNISGTLTSFYPPSSIDIGTYNYKITTCGIPADAMILCAMKPENILDELRLWKTKYNEQKTKYDELLIAFSSAVGRNNVRKMI